jgi:hypothetical protein
MQTDSALAVPGNGCRSSCFDDCGAGAWALQMIEGAWFGLPTSSMTLHACFAIADWLPAGARVTIPTDDLRSFFVPSRVFRGRPISLAVFDQEIAARSTKSRKKKCLMAMTRTPLTTTMIWLDRVWLIDFGDTDR